MRIVVLNSSRKDNGNSAQLAKDFLQNQKYTQVNLADYHINQTGQHYGKDQLDDVTKQISKADVLVITTPTYWSSMPGYLKTFIDRSGDPMSDKFNGIKVFLLMQGMAPDDALKPTAYVVNHWATRDGMKFMGIASTSEEINKLQKLL